MYEWDFGGGDARYYLDAGQAGMNGSERRAQWKAMQHETRLLSQMSDCIM